MSLVFWSGILFLAYLLGSFPSGYLIVRLLTQDDVRNIGSGSTGATNVTRKAGVKAGLMTYVLDVGKGMLAVYVAGQLSGHNVHVMGSAGAIAILGHMFPIFLKFQGGKGVATGVGVFLLLAPVPTLAVFAVWGLIFALTRTVSLGSVVATGLLPVAIWAFEGVLVGKPASVWIPKLLWGLGIGLLIISKHHENIRRLLSGTESSFKKQGSEVATRASSE